MSEPDKPISDPSLPEPEPKQPSPDSDPVPARRKRPLTARSFQEQTWKQCGWLHSFAWLLIILVLVLAVWLLAGR